MWTKMDDEFYSIYHLPIHTVDEDYGPAMVPTGILDKDGEEIMKPNPNRKQRIGFHLPS